MENVRTAGFCKDQTLPIGVQRGTGMTAVEAMIYCLGFVNDVPEDGEFLSQTAYDCNGEPHWFSWNKDNPRMCSESMTPFSNLLAPYRYSREH